MTTPRGILPLALAAVLLLPQSAGAATTDAYYERSLMIAANGRCGLFSPAVARTLEAGGRQARGAALRAGAGRSELDAVRRRAELRAYSLSCGSPDLLRAAARVRDAFEGYAKLWSMDFPGDAASWTAFRARPTERAPDARWALSQTGAGGATFGLVADREGRALTVVIPGAEGASGARLVMRDPRLAGAPYIDPNVRGLAGRAAPRSVSRIWLASGRAPAQGLSASGGEAFRFPAEAITAMEALDPRETVTVELVFPTRDGGDTARKSLFEVGDFAAASAFLAVR